MGVFKRLVLTGVHHLKNGATDYEEWSRRMLLDFGPAIKPFLRDIMKWSRIVPTREADNKPTEHGRYPFMSHSILVVDDEPNIVLSLEYLMKQEGYEVRTARSGEEALQEIRENLPDLILLDIMMPKPDGYEVCQAIRANPEWKDIAVIMLTAKGRDVEREKGLALGADDYITKPFATLEVVERVKKILEERSRKP
jgi:CheY-like chemotaxis protein